MTATTPRTTTSPRSGRSRLASSTCTRRCPTSRQNARPEKRVAGQKTASGIFFAAPSKTHQENTTQTLGTHQENYGWSYDFASGCAVAPNSTLQDAMDGGYLLADNNNSQVGAALARQRAIQGKRDLVNDLATALNGAQVFSLDGDFTKQYPVGSNKCSAFVGYVLLVAGLDANSHVNGRAGLGFYTAAEWAYTPNRVLNGWRVLSSAEMPRGGDIFAWKLTGGEGRYTGHTGIVVNDGSGGITYMAAHGGGVYPDSNQLSQAPSPGSIVYRRYVGTGGAQ